MVPGIAIEKSSSGRESTALQRFALDHNIPCRFVPTAAEIPTGWMAAGSIEFVEAALGRSFPPDHFPEFCQEHIGRKWWVETEKLPEDQVVFIKPADRLKRFDAQLRTPRTKPPHGPWLVQEPVEFIREFRYYILRGEIVTGAWYPTPGTPDPEPIPEAPPLPVQIPPNWSGTLDFGDTADGRFLLVEAHHAFACGWYGENQAYPAFAQWLIGGWKQLSHHGNPEVPADAKNGTGRPRNTRKGLRLPR